MGILSISLTASTRCPKCKQPLHLNGASESVLCDACRTPMATPPAFWKSLLEDTEDEAVDLQVGERRSSTIILTGRGLTVELEYQRLAPCCGEECNTPYSPAQIEAALAAPQGGELTCSQCRKTARARPAPAWLGTVYEGVRGVIDQASSGADVPVDPRAVRFHCYHCGGNLPLDGGSRAVVCGYCSAHVAVPDEIWLRLHPARTRERWFVLLGGAHVEGALPMGVEVFGDFERCPDGGMVVAFHSYENGKAGHPARLVRIDRSGQRVWEQDGIAFSVDAELGLCPGDARIVVVDDGGLRFVDSATGEPVEALDWSTAPQGEGLFSVEEDYLLAFDWDGSLLVSRDWQDGDGHAGEGLRRFARDGTRLPTWPGLPVTNEAPDKIEWAELRDRPLRLPENTGLVFGWDGYVYLYCRRLARIAKLTREGTLLGVMSLPGATEIVGEDVESFGVARDGTMYALVWHAVPFDGGDWPHVLRIKPQGAFEVFLGPHAASPTFLGRHRDRLRVFPDGSLHLGSDIDSLRILAPDGSTVWRSRATERRDARQLEQYTRAREDAGRR
jgi:hypothetical protein